MERPTLRRIAAGLAAATLVIGGCGGLSGPPRERRASGDREGGSTGSWQPIAEAPIGWYRPEGGFWIDGRTVVVAGSTVLAWHPRADSWKRLVDIPQAEECDGCGHGEAAVWTGRELLLWGGGFSYKKASRTFQGAALDPGTLTLRPIPDAPVPARWWHTAVWTGREMIVWGGGLAGHERKDGAAYDPASDTWRRIPDAPIGGYAHTAVWTGTEMLVWGGSEDYESEGTKGCVTSFIAKGAAYDPKADAWRTIASAPLEPRGWHTAVWTGKHMMVWGGATGLSCAYAYPASGASYDPIGDSWTTIPPSPISGRVEASVVWTGREMLLWGGSTHGRSLTLDDGATYDPPSRTWTALPPAPIEGRALHVAILTPEGMLVWGGCCNVTPEFEDSFRDGALFKLDEPLP